MTEAREVLSGRSVTIVLGLGNPLLGDDGVGWRVADELERHLPDAGPDGLDAEVEVDRLSVGGLRLMERLAGYESAIVIDAATVPGRRAGSVETCLLEDLPDGGAGHLDSAHDTSLRTALALGRRVGARLPSRVAIVTVQAESVFEFGESLTPAVEAAVPEAVAAVVKLLSEQPALPSEHPAPDAGVLPLSGGRRPST